MAGLHATLHQALRGGYLRLTGIGGADLAPAHDSTHPCTMYSRCLRTLILLILLYLLGACVSTRVRVAEHVAGSRSLGAGSSVVLIEPDVELYSLMPSGLTELRADWTEQARTHLDRELRQRLAARGAGVLTLSELSEAEDRAARRQIELLYQALANSILNAELAPELLPTKRDRFDWTLGPGVSALRAPDQARYALFVLVRDSYASAGRKALMVLGPLLGVGASGGTQIGVASLVDLRNGKVIWFNLLVAQRGDLREAETARVAIDSLLQGLPL